MTKPNNDGAPWYLNRQRKVVFNEEDYAAFLAQLYQEVADRREFTVVISSDMALRRANRRFCGERSSTDVLSFPDGENSRLGDILISAGHAKQQAVDFGHSVEQELKILVLHGLLHLMGYDHKTDAGEMEQVETYWRRELGLPVGLVERTRL